MSELEPKKTLDNTNTANDNANDTNDPGSSEPTKSVKFRREGIEIEDTQLSDPWPIITKAGWKNSVNPQESKTEK